MTDFELMGAALDEARKAAALGEVPVGAVVARNGQIVAAAHNTRETARRWAAGGCGSVSCSSRWSPAPCARGPS